jgi:hypothetical protein
MKIVRMIRSIFGGREQASRPRSIVLMQRKPHVFTEEELRAAAERGWGKKFDGVEDPMFFVSADHAAITVIKAGSTIIRIVPAPGRYSDNDEYALSQLPRPEQKKAWNEHHTCVFLEFFNDLSSKPKEIRDVDAYASLATLALQLGDPNCTAIYVPVLNIMLPNDGTAEEGLRLIIGKKMPLAR